MSEYKGRVLCKRPTRDDWRTIAWLEGDDEAKLKKDLQVCLMKWQNAAMDFNSPIYGWEFMVAP